MFSKNPLKTVHTPTRSKKGLHRGEREEYSSGASQKKKEDREGQGRRRLNLESDSLGAGAVRAGGGVRGEKSGVYFRGKNHGFKIPQNRLDEGEGTARVRRGDTRRGSGTQHYLV